MSAFCLLGRWLHFLRVWSGGGREMEDYMGQFKGICLFCTHSFNQSSVPWIHSRCMKSWKPCAQEENALVKVAFSHHLFSDSNKVLSRSKK